MAASWQAMPWSIRILRAFLGVTFVWAGFQKFLDRNFLRAGSATYVGVQLKGFAQGSPVAPVLHLLEKVPLLTGAGIALTELVVGLAVLLGFGLIAAAAVGLAINLFLWLSATWHVHPYFLGSDSIYAVAWLALILGAWEVERGRHASRMPTVSERLDGLGRREMLRGGALAAASLGMAAIGLRLAGPAKKGLGGLASSTTASSAPTGSSAPAAVAQAGSSAAPTAAPAVQGRVLATLAQLPIGKAVGFTAADGSPAALVRLADGSVVAYSRICTHAGCAVGYDTSAHLLVCPCHGAEFDPAAGAQPLPGGPTSIPLTKIRVVLDQASGKVILPQ